MAIAINEDLYLNERKIQLKELLSKKDLDSLKSYILFEGNNISGTITENGEQTNFNNYKKVVIYGNCGYGFDSVEVFEPNGKTVCLSASTWSDTYYIRYSLVKLQDDKFTINQNKMVYIYGNATGQRDADNKITKIVGYK